MGEKELGMLVEILSSIVVLNRSVYDLMKVIDKSNKLNGEVKLNLLDLVGCDDDALFRIEGKLDRLLEFRGNFRVDE